MKIETSLKKNIVKLQTITPFTTIIERTFIFYTRYTIIHCHFEYLLLIRHLSN